MRDRLALVGVAILLLAGGSWVVSTQTLPHRPMAAHKVKGAVIPGHGPLSNRAGMVRWQSTFKTMLDRVRGMARESGSRDAIAQMLVKDYEFQPAAINQLDALLAELK